MSTDLDEKLPMVLADALQVQLVLVNLLHNAMESMDAAAEGPKPPVSISAVQTNDEELEIRVADRGRGVPSDLAQEIFDSLYSTKPNGMGVGLATCRAIVQAHAGRIWCTPNPAGGAIFHFTLSAAHHNA
jgi:signal transduction histidine kinase